MADAYVSQGTVWLLVNKECCKKSSVFGLGAPWPTGGDHSYVRMEGAPLAPPKPPKPTHPSIVGLQERLDKDVPSA